MTAIHHGHKNWPGLPPTQYLGPIPPLISSSGFVAGCWWQMNVITKYYSFICLYIYDGINWTFIIEYDEWSSLRMSEWIPPTEFVYVPSIVITAYKLINWIPLTPTSHTTNMNIQPLWPCDQTSPDLTRPDEYLFVIFFSKCRKYIKGNLCIWDLFT